MDYQQRLVELEILCNTAQIIVIETQGMRWENEQWLILGQQISYRESDFKEKAEDLRKINDQLEILKYVS